MNTNSQKLLPGNSAESAKTSSPNIEYFEWGVSEAKVKALEKKYPWYPILMNWVVFILLCAALVECFAWAMSVHTERKAMAYAEEAVTIYQAEEAQRHQEEEAIRLAELNSEAAKREADTILMAKLFAGINNFVEKYGYSEYDLRTYGECVINRVLSKTNGFGSISTISDAILQRGQWVGFSEDNKVISQYYKIAASIVNEYYDDEPRPCTSSFRWAELRDDGIWLRNEYENTKYCSTWRYIA